MVPDIGSAYIGATDVGYQIEKEKKINLVPNIGSALYIYKYIYGATAVGYQIETYKTNKSIWYPTSVAPI